MSERFFYNNTESRSDLHSINATDLTAVIALPTGQILELATLSMVSLSTHRDGFPVTSLGNVGPRGFTRGHRLAAGTLVFSVFERSAFTKLMNPLEAPKGYTSTASREKRTEIKSAFYNMHADELPPFDIHMIYTTPEGLQCYEALLGVIIVDQGSVRSMDLIQIQESYAYMATDHIPIQRLEELNIKQAGATTSHPPAVHAPPKKKVLLHAGPADAVNYRPTFQAANRGKSTAFPAESFAANPNNTDLNGPNSHYTNSTWRDRWEVRLQGNIVASGFKRSPSATGWLVARDATPGDGDVNSLAPKTLTITVPGGTVARLGDYTASYDDGFLQTMQGCEDRHSTVVFSVAPENYGVSP